MADLLLVDNDERITELLALFLRRSGHAVRTARSFARARDELARARPDLLLSDLDLGAERGLDELPRLSRAGLLPPTMVVSGYLDHASQRELERLPEFVGALAKPFDLRELESRIRAALERPRSEPAPGGAEDEGWVDVVPEAGGE